MSSATVLAWVPGFWEWVLIAIVAVLLFGRRLPEVGRSLGKGVVEFKKGLREVEDEVQSAGATPPAASGSEGEEKVPDESAEKPEQGKMA